MLINIETFFLDALLNAEAVSLLDDGEDDEADNECEYCYDESTECLNTYTCLYAIELRIAEHTSEDGTEKATYTMYRNCTNRIIDVTNLIDKAYAPAHDHTDDEADESCCPDVNTVSTSSDADQSGKDTVAHH